MSTKITFSHYPGQAALVVQAYLIFCHRTATPVWQPESNTCSEIEDNEGMEIEVIENEANTGISKAKIKLEPRRPKKTRKPYVKRSKMTDDDVRKACSICCNGDTPDPMVHISQNHFGMSPFNFELCNCYIVTYILYNLDFFSVTISVSNGDHKR